MTNYYQQPLSTKELQAYDNRDDISYATIFNIKAPTYRSELYDKVNAVRQARQFKHTARLSKFNLTINNAVQTRSPLFN